MSEAKTYIIVNDEKKKFIQSLV